MKKIFFLLLAFSFALFSCKKDESGGGNGGTTQRFPLDAAADYVGYAFSKATGGIDWHLERMAYMASQQEFEQKDSSFVMKNPASDTVVKFEYNAQYSYLLLNPDEYYLDFYCQGGFSSPVLNSLDQPTGTWYMTGISTSSNYYKVNGNGTDGGSQYNKAFNINQSSIISYTFHDVLIDKNSLLAAGGTATVNISGSGVGYSSFAYTGTLTFMGNRMAKLILNDTSYTVNLAKAKVTQP